MYSINLKIFGDGPMNLSYSTRNNKMLEFINKAIADNKGKKILVLTGAEHKHYFDKELSKRTDLQLTRFNNILPLKKAIYNKNLTDFIEKNLAKGYYDLTASNGIDMMYQGALISLIHSLGMDDDPAIIPADNVVQAEQILEQWKLENPQSAYLSYEIAWVNFLKGNYNKSISCLLAIEKRLNEIPESLQWFVKSYYYRNLGFCYDMTGKREEALKCYSDGIEMCRTLKANQAFINSLYKTYIEHPYNGQNKK